MAFTYLGSRDIALVECLGGKIFQSRFIEKWGEGIHHIGCFVDGVDAEVAALVIDGAKLLIHDPGRFAYLGAGGPGGVIFELMQRGDG